MQKREHIKSESYIEWLKSLGCILWLPFSEDGDLNDRISGNNLQRASDNTGYFAWDNNNQMMYFHSPSYRNVKSYTLSNNWGSSTFPNNEFTVLSTFKRKTTSGYAVQFMVGNTYTTPIGAALIYNGSTNLANMGNIVHKSAYYLSPSIRKLYKDGTLYSTPAAHTPFLPYEWGSYDYFVGGYSDLYSGIEYYIKDIMMFNRELTLGEIRKIQGYE